MSRRDIDDVMTIERESFRNPWPAEAFLDELRTSSYSRCLVSRAQDPAGDSLAGYICYWILEGELMINNLAVAPAWRRRGVARSLLRHALAESRRLGCAAAYLEVRPSNQAAQALYAAEGFQPYGRRRGYYADTGEDALVLKLDLRQVAGA
jgi:ribosomal-protein-alanine N-acetyltransferase